MSYDLHIRAHVLKWLLHLWDHVKKTDHVKKRTGLVIAQPVATGQTRRQRVIDETRLKIIIIINFTCKIISMHFATAN